MQLDIVDIVFLHAWPPSVQQADLFTSAPGSGTLAGWPGPGRTHHASGRQPCRESNPREMHIEYM